MYKKLLAIQKEISGIKKDATNPFYKSKYFDINNLLEQIKPVLNKHGVVVLQALTNINGQLALSTELIDSTDGKTIGTVCPIPTVADAQKAGSAITYFRRYALQSLLALEAIDDDANDAVKPTVKAKVAKLEAEDNEPF